MSFLDALFRAQPATALVTTGGLVDVSASDPPAAGYTLQAVDDQHAIWVPSTGVDATARASAAAALAAATAAASNSIDPATLLPLHRWRASVNSQTGGLVDSLTDSGSLPKNLTAAGANRCGVLTDGAGKTYLNLAGASDYVAGVASDWSFLSDGTPFTIFAVLTKPSFASGNMNALLATMNYSSGGHGIRIGAGSISNAASSPTPLSGWELAVYNGSTLYAMTHWRFVPVTAISVMAWQYVGYAKSGFNGEFSGTNPVTTSMAEMQFWQNGQVIARVNDGLTGNTFATTPDAPLNVGSFPGGSGTKFTGKLYELAIYNRTFSDLTMQQLANYAASTYGAVI